MSKISKTVDMMIGKHLDAHVMGGYEFIMQNYVANDKICIFGFSRGAYTARALAGMIQKVGIIPRCNHQQVPFAYNMYSRDDEHGWEDSNAFKKAFSIDVKVDFVGVWDTVSSVGIIPRVLPFALGTDGVQCFRHALSLDERRVRFKPSTWKRPTDDDVRKKCGLNHQHTSPVLHTTSDTQQDVKEVWFIGSHCDVGGGSVHNNTRNSLARIPLRWMIRECFKAEIGILFHREAFKHIGMDPASLYPYVLERPDIIYHTSCSPAQCAPPESGENMCGTEQDPEKIYSDFISEEHEDVADAISPTHDELKKSWWWWILEYLPQPVYYQDSTYDKDTLKYSLNKGKGRYVLRKMGVKFHRSIKIRMEANCAEDKGDGRYVPKAEYNLREEEPEWVD